MLSQDEKQMMMDDQDHEEQEMMHQVVEMERWRNLLKRDSARNHRIVIGNSVVVEPVRPWCYINLPWRMILMNLMILTRGLGVVARDALEHDLDS